MEEKENINDILAECEEILKNGDQLLKELEEQKRLTDFLLNEYRTNKRWFRDEPGRVTIEDVIKRCFEFGWASKNQFDYSQSK